MYTGTQLTVPYPELYNVRRIGIYTYRMVKFDGDFNVIDIHVLRKRSAIARFDCNCWHKNKHICRHRNMIELFILENKVDNGWFYDWDTGQWALPLTHPVRLLEQRLARS